MKSSRLHSLYERRSHFVSIEQSYSESDSIKPVDECHLSLTTLLYATWFLKLVTVITDTEEYSSLSVDCTL